MKLSRFTVLIHSIAGITLLALLTPAAYAQGATPQRASSGNVLGQLSAAFSGGRVVQEIQLSGNATWHVGSLEDFGTVSRTASKDGYSQMQLVLSTTGQRSETQTGAGPSADCQWAGADGVAHEVDSGNCWKPMLWFLPAFSLQSSLLPSYLETVDLGLGTVGSSTNVYRHVQSQLVFSSLPSTQTTDIVQRSASDLYLDPASLMPSVLTYTVHPDNGSQVNISIEIRYSDYRKMNGAMIPYRIQRYVNGSLQLDIQLDFVQLS
jgi:hypothetical protein